LAEKLSAEPSSGTIPSQKATDCRKSRLNGVDPIDDRRAARSAAKLEAAKAITFEQRPARTASPTPGRRRTRVSRAIAQRASRCASRPCAQRCTLRRTVALVMRVLEQKIAGAGDEALWRARPETASRVRGPHRKHPRLGDGARLPSNGRQRPKGGAAKVAFGSNSPVRRRPGERLESARYGFPQSGL